MLELRGCRLHVNVVLSTSINYDLRPLNGRLHFGPLWCLVGQFHVELQVPCGTDPGYRLYSSNGICERMHQTVGSVLRTLIHTQPPHTLADAKGLVDQALATAAHAVRANVSQVTGYSPGALAFHRDMLLDVPIIVDLLAIRERRQLSVDENLRRVNARRSSYDYQPGQQVLKKRHEWTKLGERWDGPFPIKRVHVNGNLTIELRQGVTERINIRRVKPYHTPS